MLSRRKSVVNISRRIRREADRDDSALELERLEQETTLVLQEIDHNLSRANAVINDKMFPILKKYAYSTNKVWENAGFWKHFLQEAWDLKINTVSEAVSSKNDALEMAETRSPSIKLSTELEKQTRVSSNDSLVDLPHIQASTPQQARSRVPLIASHSGVSPIRRRSGGDFRRVSSSLARNTPLRQQSEAEARRLSLIQKHLNSSPTLPETPKFRSDLGRMNSGSSSSAARVSGSGRGLSSSDSDDLELNRLLPVLLPTLTLTPSNQKKDEQQRSAQRFPNTPVFSSSAQKSRSRRHSFVSPVKRGHDNNIELDVELPRPVTFAMELRGEDESEEIAAPELKSLRIPEGKRSFPDPERGSSEKRRVLSDEGENVFLENSTANKSTATIYHMANDISGVDNMAASNSRSMSQIFQRVLPSGASEYSQTNINNAGNADRATETEEIIPASNEIQSTERRPNSTRDDHTGKLVTGGK